MKRRAVINVVGLSQGLIGPATPNIKKFAEGRSLRAVRPLLPALTCPVQSTYLTGKLPSEHGIVANGWYDRQLAEHHFWKQSNHLVGAPKLWQVLRERYGGEFTCAKLFWWYNMYSDADYTITPRPMYPADGRKFFDIYTRPESVRGEIKKDIGEFPFHTFWGPGAGIASSQWIADSARWTERRCQPSLSLVYLPHLDYDLQRCGHGAAAAGALGEIDALVGDLLEFYEERGVAVTLLSEYGITGVDRPIHLNRLFRDQGWFQTRGELGLEMADLGASRVFAIADHQVAHIYLNDRTLAGEVRRLLEGCNGICEVLEGDAKKAAGLDHARAGDLVAIADVRSWFTYYYWMDDARAPDFARCVDIHRKIGYDPVELFLDPAHQFPKLKIAWRLLQKKFGMRMLMDVIPLDAGLVKGSHGRVPEDSKDWPVLIGDFDVTGDELEATDVFSELLLQFS